MLLSHVLACIYLTSYVYFLFTGLSYNNVMVILCQRVTLWEIKMIKEFSDSIMAENKRADITPSIPGILLSLHVKTNGF